MTHGLDLERLWNQSQSYMFNRWRHLPQHVDELKGIASEEFVRFVQNDWEELSGRLGIPVTATGAFYHLVKKHLDWAARDYFTRTLRLDRDNPETIDEDVEQFYTQLRSHDGDRMLQRRVAHHARHLLTFRERVVTALASYEELLLTEIAVLVGIVPQAAAKAAKTAAQKLSVAALSEVSNKKLDLPRRSVTTWTPPNPLFVYIDERYGLPIDAWLARVELDYALDVGYLVEILDRANAKQPHHGKAGHMPRKSILTDEQRDYIHAELDAGSSMASIARHLKVYPEVVRRARIRREQFGAA